MTTIGSTNSLWDLSVLQKPPQIYQSPDCGAKGREALYYENLLNTPELQQADSASEVDALFYEGLPYKGKPTKVFAFRGIPKQSGGKKLPGIVLVHGGGGTAFESWVRLWNARGYVAISMDTCGCLPTGEYKAWERHEDGGPAGWGAFDRVDDPPQDQWSYHAAANIVLAHSLLRSMPEVDQERIGITGISWGGYLTCIAAGIDSRFRFAAPVYGCGFLGDNSGWLKDFDQMGPERSAKWLNLWDPSVYLKGCSSPMLWVTGTNDVAYPMDSLQKSYRLPQGPRTLCVRVAMPHGHGGSGENPMEIKAFADQFCGDSAPMAKVTAQGREQNEARVEYISPSNLERVELNYTSEEGPWAERQWKTVPGRIVDEKTAVAELPTDARVYYMNLIDERGLVVSTEHVEL